MVQKPSPSSPWISTLHQSLTGSFMLGMLGDLEICTRRRSADRPSYL